MESIIHKPLAPASASRVVFRVAGVLFRAARAARHSCPAGKLAPRAFRFKGEDPMHTSGNAFGNALR